MPFIQRFNGVDFVSSPAKIAEDEVASANNIDFALEDESAGVRMGSAKVLTVSSGSRLERIFRHYSEPAPGSADWYIADSAGNVRRVTGGFSTPSASTVASGLSTDENDETVFVSWRDDVFFAGSTVSKRSAGGTTVAWVPPTPANAVTLASGTLAPLTVLSTWTVTEGVGGPTFVGTATATTDATSFRLVMQQATANTNLDSNSGNTIGDYGVHSVDIYFDEPTSVSRVMIEYSVGDATFDNKLVAELDPDADFIDVLTSPDTLIEGALEVDGEAVDAESVAEARSVVRDDQRSPQQVMPAASDSYYTFSVAAPNFKFVGRSTTTDMTSINACRLVVEAAGQVVVRARNWVVQGSENHPLNDVRLGYSYWETFARVETIGGQDIVVDESAPNSPSVRARCLNAQIVVTSPNAAPGEGMTHRILYRQGGYLRDSYAVSTHAVATATVTDTLSDIDALLLGNKLDRNVRASFPQAPRGAAVHAGRMFVGYDNRLIWSYPGKPGTFPKTSETEVSHTGDRIQGLFVQGNNLVVVNRDTVYEMAGNVFEGPTANWTLQRSNARGGSVASRATVRTPLGIFMVRDEGVFMYRPGAGVDQPIQWAMDKMADVFKGNGAFDPAQQKGSRCGSGLNGSRITHCVAEWHDNKIYLGIPDGSDTWPSRVFVLDFIRQRVWSYTFPWTIRSMWADRDSNALLFGTTGGGLMRFQQGYDDDDDGVGGATNITWSIITRRWTTPGGITGNTVSVEQEGDTNGVVRAVWGGTNTDVLGTLSSTNRDWEDFSLAGVSDGSLEFNLSGTADTAQHRAVRALQWDGLEEPKVVTYNQDDEDDQGWQCEKIWDGITADIEGVGTGTITAVTFVDGTAVATNTVGSPFSRTLVHWSLPKETLGDIVYTTYTGVDFKKWGASRYTARREPCRVNQWITDHDPGEERFFHAIDYDIDPNGTVTSTLFVDQVAVDTFTAVGNSGRQSYTRAVNDDQFGRSWYVCHEGSLFKHYKTWAHTTPEPDRLTHVQYGPITYDSEQVIKTVVMELNPLGTTTAVISVDGTAISTSSLVGTIRDKFEVGVDLDGSNEPRVGSVVEVNYTHSTGLKHYGTIIEAEPKPFGKTTWVVDYYKVGGASRLDIAQHAQLDLEVPNAGTATATLYWDVDGTTFSTNTITYVGREFEDTITLPAMRGYNFRCRLTANTAVQVHSSSLLVHPIGVKGRVRRTVQGTPR